MTPLRVDDVAEKQLVILLQFYSDNRGVDVAASADMPCTAGGASSGSQSTNNNQCSTRFGTRPNKLGKYYKYCKKKHT